MRKIFLFVLAFLLCGGWLFSQSLRDTDEYKNLKTAQTNYEQAYADGDYDKAMGYAQDMRRYAELLNQMADARLNPGQTVVVPQGDFVKYYVVKPGDCFWMIAQDPAVFSDAYKWEELYKMNKSVLNDPDNPSIINPGMTFEIPSLSGENRTGTK